MSNDELDVPPRGQQTRTIAEDLWIKENIMELTHEESNEQ